MRPTLYMLLLPLFACATADELAEAPASHQPTQGQEPAAQADPESLSQDGLAPFPYTPEQIRGAHPTGSVVLFLLENDEQPDVWLKMFFDASDDETTVVTTTVTDEAGNELGVPQSAGSTWEELRDHAAFAADRTVRTRGSCTVPAGTYECWLYTVSATDGSTKRYWFALQKPGPPVLVETELGGQVVSRMSMLQFRRG